MLNGEVILAKAVRSTKMIARRDRMKKTDPYTSRELNPVKPRETTLTFSLTVALSSWKFIIASEILTFIGSTTVSMLNGPSRRCATMFNASVEIQNNIPFRSILNLNKCHFS